MEADKIAHLSTMVLNQEGGVYCPCYLTQLSCTSLSGGVFAANQEILASWWLYAGAGNI